MPSRLWAKGVGLGGFLDDAAGPDLWALGGAGAVARGRLISQDVTDDPMLRSQLFEQETEQEMRGERAGLQRQLLARLRKLREQEGEQLRATEGGFLAFERPDGEGLDLDDAVDFRPMGGGTVRGRLGSKSVGFAPESLEDPVRRPGASGSQGQVDLGGLLGTLRGPQGQATDLTGDLEARAKRRLKPSAEIAAKLKEKIAEARERRESLREERRALEAELLGGRPTSVGAVQGALRERREKVDAEQMSDAIDELRKIKKDAAALARDNPMAAKAFEDQQLGLLERTLSKRVREKLGLGLTAPKESPPPPPPGGDAPKSPRDPVVSSPDQLGAMIQAVSTAKVAEGAGDVVGVAADMMQGLLVEALQSYQRQKKTPSAVQLAGYITKRLPGRALTTKTDEIASFILDTIPAFVTEDVGGFLGGVAEFFGG